MNHLVVMVKEPRPGRVKTRLARGMGRIPATWWYRHQMRALLRRLVDPRWQITLAVAPDRAVLSPIWNGIPRLPQGPGDLGARMARVLRIMPPGPLCIIGSDIPGITSAHIARAFASLGSHEAVFGPALDGGYWLIGHNRLRLPAGMLQEVRWSSDHALADSIRSLGGQRVGMIDELRDVDQVSDLKA